MNKDCSRIVEEGSCFKILARKLFPNIDAFFGSLPSSAPMSYTAKLKELKLGMRPTARTAVVYTLPDNAQKEAFKRSLRSDYSFLLRLEMETSDGTNVSQKEAIFMQGNWTFDAGDYVSLTLELVENDVELPLWPSMDDPLVDAENLSDYNESVTLYEDEARWRKNFRLVDYNDNAEPASNFTFEVFIVEKKSRRIASLFRSGGYDVVLRRDPVNSSCTMLTHFYSDGLNFGGPWPTCSPDCDCCPTKNCFVHIREKLTLSQDESGVPMLKVGVVDLRLHFSVCLSEEYSCPMSLGVLARELKRMFP